MKTRKKRGARNEKQQQRRKAEGKKRDNIRRGIRLDRIRGQGSREEGDKGGICGDSGNALEELGGG
jgi:hypothetical protein